MLGALFHAKWLLPQVNLHPHFPPASLCSLPRHEDRAAGYERALRATFWPEVSLQHCHCWACSYLCPSCSLLVVPASLGPCFLEQTVLPSQRWGCIPRLPSAWSTCLWQHCCVGIFFCSSLDATPSESLCWKHCWFVQFTSVIMCAESSLAFFIS